MSSMRCFPILILMTSILAPSKSTFLGKAKDTDERIESNGLPVERHIVHTADGYILTLFRIPSLNNDTPIIFLQHGLALSSDCWLMNGRENSLAYMLADAGFDVWLGNARGNTYSKSHSNLSTFSQTFWRFSWHELGIYDLPASIDYVLKITKQSALHYVGHSEGTTSFMVMLSLLPDYNAKIKTSHMLAPVVYNSHMRSPLAKVLGPLLGSTALLSNLLGSWEFRPTNKLLDKLGRVACRKKLRNLCNIILLVNTGWSSPNLNFSALADIFETNLSGASTNQFIHYLQGYASGKFRQYDYGLFENIFKYGQMSPPSYPIRNIAPYGPILMYYSDSDCFAAVIDVENFASELDPKKVNLYQIEISEWSHMDFIWSTGVREVINERIIDEATQFENFTRN